MVPRNSRPGALLPCPPSPSYVCPPRCPLHSSCYPPPAPFPWSGFLQLLLLSPTSPIPMGTTHGGCAARPTQLDGLRVRQGGVVATKSAVEANDWQEGSVVSLAKLGQAFRSEGSRHAPRTRGCQSPRPSLSIRTFRLSGAVALSYNSGPITSHQCVHTWHHWSLQSGASRTVWCGNHQLFSTLLPPPSPPKPGARRGFTRWLLARSATRTDTWTSTGKKRFDVNNTHRDT